MPSEPGKRTFSLFWFSRVSTSLGMHMQTTVMGWHVYDLARLEGRPIPEAALLLGLIGLLSFFPLLVFSLYAGSIADRFSQRHILMYCLAARILVSAGLIAMVLFAGTYAIEAIMVASFCLGVIQAFQPAANVTMLSRIVERPHLHVAIARISLGVQGGIVAGPFVGGVLFAVSPPLAYAACALSYGLALRAMIPIRYRRVRKDDAEPATKSPESMLEGLRYVWRTKLLLGAVSLDFTVRLLAGAIVLLPAIARDVLHLGPEEMGMLRSCMAVGGMATALTLSRMPINHHYGRWMFGSTIVYGLATVAFGLSATFIAAGASLVVIGSTDLIAVYLRQTLLQLVPPDDLRGRVAAFVTVARASSLQLGDFESGVVARFIGPVNAVVVGGLAALVASLIWMIRFPELRRRDTAGA